jgi:hypothetical protein
MSNILVNIEKGVEVGAADLLKWLTSSQKAAPAVIAALAILAQGVGNALENVQAAAAAPLNIALDEATIASLKNVWPEVKAFLESLGVKF